MAKIREITGEKYERLWSMYFNRSLKLSREKSAFYFSNNFSPYSGIELTGEYKLLIQELYHFSKQPCNEFAKENLPVVTCLTKLDSKFYLCRHKVGNCPWKILDKS